MIVEMNAISRLLPTASARPGRPSGLSQASIEKPCHVEVRAAGGVVEAEHDHDHDRQHQVERHEQDVERAAASGPRSGAVAVPARDLRSGAPRAVAAAIRRSSSVPSSRA